jgi:mono/diheme cytochrome c family protein
MSIVDCRLPIWVAIARAFSLNRQSTIDNRQFRLLALLCIVVSGCSGCGGNPDAYPENFSYPSRQEWIVVELPKEAPTKLEPPGELDAAIQRINEHGGKVLDPSTVPTTLRDELNEFLQRSFGTPAKPTIAGDNETKALADGLGLSDENLAMGSRLFRKHCQECHGPTGNGRGPTAPWITPHPRDFRQGVFKFVSTNGTGSRKPTRADLFATLTNGLPTTQMPSFALRSEDERHRLIDYVMFLSVRGRTEFEILKTLLVHGEGGLDQSISVDAAAVARSELRAWSLAQGDLMPATAPATSDDELPQSIRRGHALFLDAKGAACATCHANFGREAKFQFDVWGTVVKPGDLTDVRRKGGMAPEQLYRRIHGGIGPSNMPAAVTLTEAQTWDVVNFHRALPYPDQLPDDVKKKITPQHK